MALNFFHDADKPSASITKFWVIRRCHALKSPAIFSNWDDFRFYVDAEAENDSGGDFVFRSFDNLPAATSYAFPSIVKIKNEDEGEMTPAASPTSCDGLMTTTVNANDVLCGRGGLVNHNPGNKAYRDIVSRHKQSYADEMDHAKKTTIAWGIVAEIRKFNPPGRFLQRNADGDWFDIGEARAVAKTKQALREIIDDGIASQPSTPSSVSVSPLLDILYQPTAKKARLSLENFSAGLNRCIPLKQPIPKQFAGDIESMRHVEAPRFCNIANFLQRPKENCSMCGEVRHIPQQNKGVCNGCDVKVWLHTESDLQLKWCKGCKNFRVWAAFGEKGHTTKCLPCRESQAKRYMRKKSLET